MPPGPLRVPVSKRAEVEVPICRSYNRWLGDIWAHDRRRLRWTVVPPLTDLEESIKELQYGKAHGACGVFLRAVEGERFLNDPYWYPLYAFVRRQGHGPEDARDLTQGYFAQLLEKGTSRISPAGRSSPSGDGALSSRPNAGATLNGCSIQPPGKSSSIQKVAPTFSGIAT